MTVKTLLAILIFTGLGTIIFGGGVVIMKYYNGEINNKIAEPAKNMVEHKKNILMYDYQVDDKFLYFKGVKVDELAPNFDQYKKYGFYLMKNSVYCLSPACNKRMEGSDPSTFKVLNWEYSKDKNFVYYSRAKLYTAGNIIEGADTDSFEVISGRYAKDKNSYYDQGKSAKNIPERFIK